MNKSETRQIAGKVQTGPNQFYMAYSWQEVDNTEYGTDSTITDDFAVPGPADQTDPTGYYLGNQDGAWDYTLTETQTFIWVPDDTYPADGDTPVATNVLTGKPIYANEYVADTSVEYDYRVDYAYTSPSTPAMHNFVGSVGGTFVTSYNNNSPYSVGGVDGYEEGSFIANTASNSYSPIPSSEITGPDENNDYYMTLRASVQADGSLSPDNAVNMVDINYNITLGAFTVYPNSDFAAPNS